MRHARHHLPQAGELFTLHELALGVFEFLMRFTLRLGCLFELTVLLFQLPFGALAGGDVAAHADDAANAALSVAQGNFCRQQPDRIAVVSRAFLAIE